MVMGFCNHGNDVCIDCCADLTERAEKAEAKLVLMEQVFDDLPKCSGEWISGSGGHRNHTPCQRYATWAHHEDNYAYCEQHVADFERGADKVGGYYEVVYADAIRKYEATIPQG